MESLAPTGLAPLSPQRFSLPPVSRQSIPRRRPLGRNGQLLDKVRFLIVVAEAQPQHPSGQRLQLVFGQDGYSGRGLTAHGHTGPMASADGLVPSIADAAERSAPPCRGRPDTVPLPLTMMVSRRMISAAPCTAGAALAAGGATSSNAVRGPISASSAAWPACGDTRAADHRPPVFPRR